ncbi:MAG: DMT family transporter [Azospirillaceae bacterium]
MSPPASAGPAGGGVDRPMLGIGFAVLSFGCFSAADAVVKWLSGGFTVFQSIFIGTWFAFVPVLAFALATEGPGGLRPRRPAMVVLRGALVTAAALSVLWSFTRLPMTDGYALVFASPLIVTALAPVLLGERVGWRRWAAVVVGFLGVMIMLRPGFAVLDIGHAAAFASAVLFALGLLVLRRIGPGESNGALLVGLLLTTEVMVAPLMPFLWVTPRLGDVALMALSGTLAGFAHIFLVLAFKAAPAPVVAPYQYSQMIWGIVFGLVLFGDRPDPIVLLGAAIVIACGLYILRREMRLSRQGSPPAGDPA